MKPRKPITLAAAKAAIAAGTFRAMTRPADATAKPKASAKVAKRSKAPVAKKSAKATPIAYYDPARAARKGTTMTKTLTKEAKAAAWKKAMKGDDTAASASGMHPTAPTMTQAQKAAAWKKAMKG